MADAVIPPIVVDDSDEPKKPKSLLDKETKEFLDEFLGPVDDDIPAEEAAADLDLADTTDMFAAVGESLDEPVEDLDEWFSAEPTNAFDPTPPRLPSGDIMDVDVAAARMVALDLKRAAEPLLKSIGPSFDKLSRFGYSEPTTDPFAEGMKSQLRRLVRNL